MKYKHFLGDQNLKELKKNPLLYSELQFRTILEGVYNEQVRYLFRTNGDDGLQLSKTLLSFQSLKGMKKQKQFYNTCRLIYTADKYSDKLPEAKKFLEFLNLDKKNELLFYLYIRKMFKNCVREGFLDHLQGHFEFDQCKIQKQNAEQILLEVAEGDTDYVSKVILSFQKNKTFTYYPFIVEATINSKILNIKNVFQKYKLIHLGGRTAIEYSKKKIRFDEGSNQDIFISQENPNEFGKNTQIRAIQRKSRMIQLSQSPSKSDRSVSIPNNNLKDTFHKHLNINANDKHLVDQSERTAKTSFKETHKVRSQRKLSVSLSLLVENQSKQDLMEFELDQLRQIEDKLLVLCQNHSKDYIEKNNVPESIRQKFERSVNYSVYVKAKSMISFIVMNNKRKFMKIMGISKKDHKNYDELVDEWEYLVNGYKEFDNYDEIPDSMMTGYVSHILKYSIFAEEIEFLYNYVFKVTISHI